jgi:hypothetical protein
MAIESNSVVEKHEKKSDELFLQNIVLFKRLNTFLKQFNILNLLITVCIAYICIDQQ